MPVNTGLLFRSNSTYMTSSNIPDAISTEDLGALLSEKAADKIIADCRAEAEAEKQAFDGCTSEQVIDLAEAALLEVMEECKSPIVHKVMALSIFDKIIAWHQCMAEEALDDNDVSNAFAWAQDAGKLQTARDILAEVTVCSNDFTVCDCD